MNRPKQLNALSSAMIMELLRCFTAYEKDDKVKLLIMKGKGRAFCAGGDVSAVVRAINNDSWKYGADFFRNEFLLNYIIATYSKPQVSLLAGIVMGGGAGVSLHGRFRVVTENTVFAMPETALGLFPDIGASYFLSRLPGFYGCSSLFVILEPYHRDLYWCCWILFTTLNCHVFLCSPLLEDIVCP